MSHTLSPNTQAILLLTAPLLLRPGLKSPDTLKTKEYHLLAKALYENRSQPSDLLEYGPKAIPADLTSQITGDRIQRLLERGFLLGQVLERWEARSIWVLSRADEAYPKRLKLRMKERAPPLLYGCGSPDILHTGGLALVGPRNAEDELIKYAEGVGALVARAGRTIVSGGARGVDVAGMWAAIKSGGKAVGVLAEQLERASVNRENRNQLMDGRLVLVSDQDPNATFNAGRAMGRNKLIYAFADTSLVVNAEVEKGGTWSGAAEQLRYLRYSTVYVRSTGAPSNGLDALRALGAIDWPNPREPSAIESVFEKASSGLQKSDEAGRLHSAQLSLLRPAKEMASTEEACGQHCDTGHAKSISALKDAEAAGDNHPPVLEDFSGFKNQPAEILFSKVRELAMTILRSPRSETEFAQILGVLGDQAMDWLTKLSIEGVLEQNAGRWHVRNDQKHEGTDANLRHGQGQNQP